MTALSTSRSLRYHVFPHGALAMLHLRSRIRRISVFHTHGLVLCLSLCIAKLCDAEFGSLSLPWPHKPHFGDRVSSNTCCTSPILEGCRIVESWYSTTPVGSTLCASVAPHVTRPRWLTKRGPCASMFRISHQLSGILPWSPACHQNRTQRHR